MSSKQLVLDAINKLPDDVDAHALSEAADRAALMAAIEEARDDVRSGRVISNEEMKSRIEKMCSE